MVKNTQTIRGLLPTNYLSVFGQFILKCQIVLFTFFHTVWVTKKK